MLLIQQPVGVQLGDQLSVHSGTGLYLVCSALGGIGSTLGCLRPVLGGLSAGCQTFDVHAVCLHERRQLVDLSLQTWLIGLGLMLAIGLLVGALPALRAMRLNIVDALAGR